MDKKLTIRNSLKNGVILRSINMSDLECLRRWKNDNRMSFFYQKIITSSEQEKWFSGYLKNPKDFMLMVEQDSVPTGCMGFKLVDDAADIYNVILGDERYRRKGTISSALALLCSYIRKVHTKNVVLKVLRSNNTAVSFYLKNFFVIAEEAPDHYLMRLSSSSFEEQELEVG